MLLVYFSSTACLSLKPATSGGGLILRRARFCWYFPKPAWATPLLERLRAQHHGAHTKGGSGEEELDGDEQRAHQALSDLRPAPELDADLDLADGLKLDDLRATQTLVGDVELAGDLELDDGRQVAPSKRCRSCARTTSCRS
ncbi:hypothetical protein PF003_g34053 [Phytophthora fragariae]|nr:hypothetical protein PF003_g34053 [Phytophthora fragariae]